VASLPLVITMFTVIPLDRRNPVRAVVSRQVRTSLRALRHRSTSLQTGRVLLLQAGVRAHGGRHLADLVLVDTRARQVGATVPLGEGHPFQVALSADVESVAISAADGDPPHAGTNRVAVVDIASGSVRGAIDVGGDPFGPIGLALDGDVLYATNRGSNRVEVLSPPALAAAAPAVPVEVTTVGISSSFGFLVVASRATGACSLLDAGQVVAVAEGVVPPSDSTTSVIESPGPDHDVFVTSSASASIAVLRVLGEPARLERWAVIETQGAGLTEMAFLPGTSRLLVLSEGTGELLVIDADAGRETFGRVEQTVPSGGRPVDVVAHRLESGEVAVYVSSQDGGDIVVLGFERLAHAVGWGPGATRPGVPERDGGPGAAPLDRSARRAVRQSFGPVSSAARGQRAPARRAQRNPTYWSSSR
jgi:DNA-binding beta-propeller fold protein YncE